MSIGTLTGPHERRRLQFQLTDITYTESYQVHLSNLIPRNCRVQKNSSRDLEVMPSLYDLPSAIALPMASAADRMYSFVVWPLGQTWARVRKVEEGEGEAR